VPDAAWGCGWAWLWFWLFIFVIIVAGWGWGGWYGGWGGPYGWWPRREVPQQQAPPAAQAPPATQPAPAKVGGEFVGKTVVVEDGKVDQVFGPHVFTLAGPRDLLVVSKDAKAPAVKKGEAVQVTGKVEKFEDLQTQHETGVDLKKVPAAEFTGRPVVVASAVSAKQH
jgi:hypothetical protein